MINNEIRSTDSCFTILAAKEGIKLESDKIQDIISKTPENYFFEELTEEQMELAIANMKQMKNVIIN